MCETLSRQSHPQKVVCRLSQLLHPLLTTQDIKGNWTPISAQEI